MAREPLKELVSFLNLDGGTVLLGVCEGATLEDFRGGGVLPSHNI